MQEILCPFSILSTLMKRDVLREARHALTDWRFAGTCRMLPEVAEKRHQEAVASALAAIDALLREEGE